MEDTAVKMLVSMASVKNDRAKGAVVMVSAQEAQRLYEKGFAEPAEEAQPKKGRPPKAPAAKEGE